MTTAGAPEKAPDNALDIETLEVNLGLSNAAEHDGRAGGVHVPLTAPLPPARQQRQP